MLALAGKIFFFYKLQVRYNFYLCYVRTAEANIAQNMPYRKGKI